MNDKTIKLPMPDEYARARANLAISFCPPMGPCADCGWPTVIGYCCTTCGSSDPTRKLTAEEVTERLAWERKCYGG